jgi:hypothetical protein
VLSGLTDDVSYFPVHRDHGGRVTSAVPVGAEVLVSLQGYSARHDTGTARIVVDHTLEPHLLLSASKRWFKMGDAGRAAGSARLAYYMIDRYLPTFADRWPPVSEALMSLSAARHHGSCAFIERVVREDLWPLVRARLVYGANEYATLSQIASIFDDFMHFEDAESIRELIDATKSNALVGDGQLAREWRREALTKIIRGTNLNDAKKQLTEAHDISLEVDSNQAIGTSNALAWLLHRQGRNADAVEVLEMTITNFSHSGGVDTKVVAPWNALETALTLRAISSHQRSQSSRRAIDLVTQMHQAEPFKQVLLRPVAHLLAVGSERGVYDALKHPETMTHGLREALKMVVKRLA